LPERERGIGHFRKTVLFGKKNNGNKVGVLPVEGEYKLEKREGVGVMAIVLLKREAGVIYDFNQEHEPVLRVKSGTRVEIEAYDCFQNQVTSPETMLSEIDWNKINPATGPISIEGAQPGDVLKVTIEKLEVANRGVMATGPNLDVWGHRLNKLESKIVPVREGRSNLGM